MTTNKFGIEEESLGATRKDSNANAKTEQQYQAAPQSNGFTNSSGGDALAFLSSLGAVTATGNTGAGNTDEVVKVFTAVAARTANQQNSLKVSIVPIEDARLYISSVAMTYVNNGILFYTVYLLESISRPLANRIIPMGMGKNVEVDMTAAQYWDGVMQEVVETTLLTIENKTGLKALHLAAIVIPKIIDLTNADSIAPFFDHGIAALAANLRASHGLSTSPIEASMLADKGLMLVGKYDITPGHTYLNTIKLPIVADFNAVLYARVAGKNVDMKSVHGVFEDYALASIMGYIDFMRRPVENSYINVMPGQNMQPMAGYDPVLVITQDACLGKSTTTNDTLLTQLLALPLILPLADPAQNKWASIFEPFSGDGHNKTSIGVLGYEHNPFPGTVHTPAELQIVPGSELTRNSDKFTAQDIVRVYCTNNMIVALDILQGGPLEWIQSLFAKAVMGSPAEKTILDELDAFSNGIFSQIWRPKGMPILAAPSTDIHAGHFTAQDGKIRDIRSIDYLSMLESTKGASDLFEPFAIGFLPGKDTPDLMDQKRKILQQIAPNFIRTGMYTRIFFNNAFISAIDECVKACGLNITVEGLMDLSGIGAQRQSFNSDFLTPLQGHGTFNYYSRQQPQPAGGQQRYGSTAGMPGSFR